jgi:hypothetical protein
MLCLVVLLNSVHADGLKNSLNNMMGKDDSSQMVDLSSLNLDAKPRPVAPKAPKTRSKKTVIATINKHKIRKKDADAYLSERTKGKVKNFDRLPKPQQKRLIYELAFPILALEVANKELSVIEKETIMARVWMQKEARNVKVTVAEVREVYDTLKKQAIDNNDTREIPEFTSIQDRLHVQMVEKQMMDKLMKDMKIEIIDK